MGIDLVTGDRFIETYFTDRWYNIFEIHDRDDDRLKGWYCNIGQPIVLESDREISYVDLALDLWVTPDGTQTVLDEDEFTALDLDKETRSKARAALEELQQLIFKEKRTRILVLSTQVPAWSRYRRQNGQHVNQTKAVQDRFAKGDQ